MIGAAGIYMHEYSWQQNTHLITLQSYVSALTQVWGQRHKSKVSCQMKSLYLSLCVRCRLVPGVCCGAHLSPLSVSHALCVENANCEKEKFKLKNQILAHLGKEWTNKDQKSQSHRSRWKDQVLPDPGLSSSSPPCYHVCFLLITVSRCSSQTSSLA